MGQAPRLTLAPSLATVSHIPHFGLVPDGNTILAQLGTAIAVVGLFVVFEKRITAAIRAGKKLAVELGFFKKLEDIFYTI